MTVRIQDSTRYVAEGHDRVLRRTRSNRFRDHERMYRRIAAAIAGGRPGDPVSSLECSAGLVLDLEQRLTDLTRTL